MDDRNYINIQGWMINKLTLKGNELMLFAVIYGFSQDGETYFTGSSKYLQNILGTSRNTVTKCLNNLIQMGIVIKQTDVINGVPFNKFKADTVVVNDIISGRSVIDTPCQNLTVPLSESDTPPYQNLIDPLSNSDSNNTSNTNSSLNNRLNNSSFTAAAEEKNLGDLFSNEDPIEPTLKEKNSAKKEKDFGKPEFRQTLIDVGADPQHVDDWIKVRTAKRAGFTATSLQLLFDECIKHNFPVAEAVKVCAGRSWQGFKYEWYQKDNYGKQTANTTSQSREQRVNEVAEFRFANQQSLATRLQKYITGNNE
ncbi:helix-turn-helix domain-containing protein [Sphingobacterium thalpophilum]|uniref:helix-turn-helix domain-containing protein n=1 Tax=Sphingobacterium thalpophilum TaxID=259 RepID=UPI0024A646FC|nr:helix-turn-helix domain-containing protein [Sphingobacterium thalpophilum]